MSLNETVFNFLKLYSTLAELDVKFLYLNMGIINPNRKGNNLIYLIINGIIDGKYIAFIPQPEICS